jgi:hypothetical protein
MQADSLRHRLTQGLAAILFAACILLAGPAVPRAHADVPDWLNPCNLPGGTTVCKKSMQGSLWMLENTAVGDVATGVSTVVDFASDPLGYLEQKLRSGAKGMFSAFGEELTGKEPPEEKAIKKDEDE